MSQTEFGTGARDAGTAAGARGEGAATGDAWTVRSMLDWTRAYLERKGDEHPRRSAEWLLCAATGLSRIELYTNFDRPLEPEELDAMHDGVVRRGRGEPLQYVTGEMPFRHIVLYCSPGVLIPRPETEILVDEVLAYVDGLPDARAHVLEVGVGTGCIALSLASERPGVDVVGTDLSPAAVACATRNRDALDLADRVTITQTDLAAGVPGADDHGFDVLVSNPPYIPTPIMATLPREVVGFEPTLALDGGEDGLDVFRRLVALGTRALRPGGLFACELHEDCLVMASELPELTSSYEGIRIVKDLTGRNRHLIASLRPPREAGDAGDDAPAPGEGAPAGDGSLPATAPERQDAPAKATPERQDTPADGRTQATPARQDAPAGAAPANVVRLTWDEPEDAVVQRTAAVLAAGGVAILPTDTVYGIAQAVGANPDGARRLFQIKRRDPRKAVAWLVAGPEALDEYGVDVPAYARRLARAFWPGGLTLVVRASDRVPQAYRGPQGTIALRVPAAPVVVRLARRLATPLATTSANTSGQPAPASYAQLEPRVRDEADIVLDDGVTHAVEASTVVVCTGDAPLVTRVGTIAARLIMAEASRASS